MICDFISKSDNVICISPEIGTFPNLQYDLFLQGNTRKFPYGLRDTEEYIKEVDSHSFAIVYIPPERESARLEKVLAYLHSKGIKTAVLADKNYKSIKKYSDILVNYTVTNTNLDNIIYNTFLDIITVSYRKMYIDQE